VSVQGLPPGSEQVGDRERRAAPDEHDARRVERDERSVAARPGDPPLGAPPWRAGSDSGRHEHHPVGGEQLDMRSVAGTETSAACSEHGTAGGRMEARTAADRASLARKRGRDSLGGRALSVRAAAAAEREGEGEGDSRSGLRGHRAGQSDGSTESGAPSATRCRPRRRAGRAGRTGRCERSARANTTGSSPTPPARQATTTSRAGKAGSARSTNP
jgi:hypothetical protein